MTKAIRIHQTGGPSVMQVETVETRDPGPGELRIRHAAIGVNFIDTYHRSGLYPVPLPAPENPDTEFITIPVVFMIPFLKSGASPRIIPVG